jgi:hypothetical protein
MKAIIIEPESLKILVRHILSSERLLIIDFKKI